MTPRAWTPARHRLALAAGAASLIAASAPARADGTGVSADTGTPGRGFSIGVLAGATRPDQGLANYQWDTRSRAAWGARGLAHCGRVAAGVRLWRGSTTQDLGVPGVAAPHVGMTRVELVGRMTLATLAGTDAFASAGIGRMHLAYDPDRVSVPTGSGPPVEVRFASLDEWIGGGGLGLCRSLGRTQVGVEFEHRVFALDTAHRDGNTIENRRERFGEWSARFELAWHIGRR